MTGESEILNVAREVSTLIREHQLDAAIVGGVAVFLHGHIRTTIDVDVYARDTAAMSAVLREHGFEFDPARREFMRRGVPVHLVTVSQIGEPPAATQLIDHILTVSLADLINMKLHSGTANVLRAQDLADVIALIRVLRLTADFTPRIAKPLRAEFKRLVKAVEQQQANKA